MTLPYNPTDTNHLVLVALELGPAAPPSPNLITFFRVFYGDSLACHYPWQKIFKPK